MNTVAARLLPRLIEQLFFRYYCPGTRSFSFPRSDLDALFDSLGVLLTTDLHGLLLRFRHSSVITPQIAKTAPKDCRWTISAAPHARLRFHLAPHFPIRPNLRREQIKVPDATPGVIEKYRLSDEQGLLARVRYNRLIDLFTGLSCYSLQNHLRTTVADVGQVETDEIYVGIDRRGAHYVMPVQAKGGRDRLSVVQIGQDFALAAERFPELFCRPIGAQFLDDGAIALFEFTQAESGIAIRQETHYRLVPPEELTEEDLARYRLGK